jgi:putative multicomponent Na+:H+ antiporter subunit B
MMEHGTYIYLITALMPLTASMVVVQVNPYHALVVRGILGGVSALVYAMFGAPDVALTEALVGTMLAITLYAVAVRSSLVMRLGVLQDELTAQQDSLTKLIEEFRAIFRQHYMRVELVPYQDPEELHQALMEKEIHATCVQRLEAKVEAKIEAKIEAKLDPKADQAKSTINAAETPVYQTTIRLQRLYEIIQTKLVSSTTLLTYINPVESGETH